MGIVSFHSRRPCPSCGRELWSELTDAALLLECPGCNWSGSEPLTVSGHDVPRGEGPGT